MEKGLKLICPVCRQRLKLNGKSCVCKNSHSFDIARQGYLNLLLVQNKHSLNPGDTPQMLKARRSFLNSGKYLPICESVSEALKKYSPSSEPVVIDSGCGEGYYTSLIKQKCGGIYAGVDISKDGVRMACSRDKAILWLVATAAALPIENSSADAVIAMFSLMLPNEYARVLKKGGCVIEVTVGNDHLKELKEIIYDEVFVQDKYPSPCGKSFEEKECSEHRYTLTLNNDELRSLLMMTPHFWRIHKEKRERLEATERLEITVHYWLRVAVKR